MGIRINTNLQSLQAQRSLRQSEKKLENAMERLSSGYRINSAKDDVAGLAISSHLSADGKAMAAAQRNSEDGQGLLQLAEGSLNETSNILVRMKELSTQAASDTLGETERAYVDAEAQQLKNEIDRIAKSTQYMSNKLLDGSGKSLDFQVGITGDSNSVINFDSSKIKATSGQLGVGGIDLTDKSGARSSLESIDGALNEVGTMRSTLGSIQGRLSSTINHIELTRETTVEAVSRIRDTDYAEEASNLAKATITNQAGIAVLTQANNSTAIALKLV